MSPVKCPDCGREIANVIPAGDTHRCIIDAGGSLPLGEWVRAVLGLGTLVAVFFGLLWTLPQHVSSFAIGHRYRLLSDHFACVYRADFQRALNAPAASRAVVHYLVATPACATLLAGTEIELRAIEPRAVKVRPVGHVTAYYTTPDQIE
jgi:hypothetical protein